MTSSIALLVGSLRKESFTRRVANAITALAPSLRCASVDISRLPPFNEDLEGSPPKEWVAFRDAIRPVDGVLIATPEYNRSIPGVLKNALDVGSRPYGHSVWAHKPSAVVSVSPSGIGGFGAHHHLRQVLVYLDSPCLAQPEMYIGNASELFDAQGKLPDDTRALFASFTEAFTRWVELFAHEAQHRKSA